jgi:hypothetical protein
MSAFELDQDLVSGFVDETNEILAQTDQHLSDFLAHQNPNQFEAYGQGIDRVMGAALTLGFTDLGDLARLGKEVGYKASQVTDINQLLVIHSLLSQLNKELNRVVKSLNSHQQYEQEDLHFLIQKLKKASSNLGDLRISVKL